MAEAFLGRIISSAIHGTGVGELLLLGQAPYCRDDIGEGSARGGDMEWDRALTGACRCNLKPCLRGDVSQGNLPNLGFGARDRLCVVCIVKTR